jgi:hypothetical protein
VDVNGRWPTDAEMHEIARVLVEHETKLPLDQADVYDYLSGAVLGFRPLPKARRRCGRGCATCPDHRQHIVHLQAEGQEVVGLSSATFLFRC